MCSRAQIQTAISSGDDEVNALNVKGVDIPIQLTLSDASVLFDGTASNLNGHIRASVANTDEIFDKIMHRILPGGRHKRNFRYGPISAQIYRRGDHPTKISGTNDVLRLSSRIAVDPNISPTMRQVKFNTKVRVFMQNGGVRFRFEELDVKGLNNRIDREITRTIADEVNGEIVSREKLESGGITQLSSLKFSGNEKLLVVEADVSITLK